MKHRKFVISFNPRFFLGINVGAGYFKIKRTKNEMFSERNGYDKILRLFGVSFIYRKWEKTTPKCLHCGTIGKLKYEDYCNNYCKNFNNNQRKALLVTNFIWDTWYGEYHGEMNVDNFGEMLKRAQDLMFIELEN